MTAAAASVRQVRKFENPRTPRVLSTVEKRLRRIASRRGTKKAQATYREAADIIHALVKPRGRKQ